MLRIFLVNGLIPLILLLGLCIAFSINAFQSDITAGYDDFAPLSFWIYNIIDAISGNGAVVRKVLSVLLIFYQAVILGLIFSETRLFSKANWLPSLVYVILTPLFKDIYTLPPVLISATISIHLIRLLLLGNSDRNPYGRAFNIGLLLALAALAYFPSLIFLILIYVSFIVFRSYELQKWVMVLIGLITPFLYVFTYYYWYDKPDVLLADYFGRYLTHRRILSIELDNGESIMLFFLGGVFVVAMIHLAFGFLRLMVHKRNQIIFILWLLVLSLLAFLLQSYLTLTHFFMLLVPVTAVISVFFYRLKYKWLGDIIVLVLIVLAFLDQYDQLGF